MCTIIKIPPTSKPIIFHPMMILFFERPGTSEILIISHLIVTVGYVKR